MDKKNTKSVNLILNAPQPLFAISLRVKYIILALIAFVFYANSILNSYAFDDEMAIGKNAFVKMGFSGIPKILTNDAWASYFTPTEGGLSSKRQAGDKRYSPLSEIIFAIIWQFCGNSTLLPNFYHLINVLAYMTCIIAIFYFLEKFLLKKIPWGSDVAFMATLLFIIHPIHTEVVANIKSLDEILSLFFIMLTFIYSLKYIQIKKVKYLITGAGSFLLSLLSKESAVTALFFVPFLFYLLADKTPWLAIKASVPYAGVFIVYLLLRYNAVGLYSSSNIQDTSLFSNPYMYAAFPQKVATQWFVLGKYAGMMVFPYPLSCDYSYYQIKYHGFSDLTVIFSLLIYIALFGWGLILTRRKNVLSFAVFFYLLNILLISNLVLNIGPIMAERLAFFSSLGFVIIISYYFIKLIFYAGSIYTKIPVHTKNIVVTGVILIICAVCFGETVIRNAQWKNNTSLFIHDVGVVPNSSLANNNAGFYYIGLSERKENTNDQAKAYLDSSRKFLKRALYIYKDYDKAYLNLGIMYVHRNLPDSAKYYWDILSKSEPNLPALQTNYILLSKRYYDKGLDLCKNGRLWEGIANMKKALLMDSVNAEIWYNMGVAYFRIQQYDTARNMFIKTLRCKPDSAEIAGAQTDLEEILRMKEKAR